MMLLSPKGRSGYPNPSDRRVWPPPAERLCRRVCQAATSRSTVPDVKTVVFFPESAYGPTNNCVGIADVLRRRGHRVVFIAEESFEGTLSAKGFEERLMRLTPPSDEAEDPGQFWKDFIRETAPVF